MYQLTISALTMLHQSIRYAVVFCAMATAHETNDLEQQQVNIGKNELENEIKSHPSVIDDYFPNREKSSAYERYRISYPDTEDYSIGLLVNPCGVNGTTHHVSDNEKYNFDSNSIPSSYSDSNSNSYSPLNYDCCMSRYGSGEYGYMRYQPSYQNGVTQTPMNTLEIFRRRIPAGPYETSHNMIIVDEHGVAIPPEYSRRPDDATAIDRSCRGSRDPHPSCLLERLRAVPSRIVPSCWDHNQTVDASLGCYDPEDGEWAPNCMQVGFSQNAFVHVCGGEHVDDETCGTYIELHGTDGGVGMEMGVEMGDSVPLAERKITTRATNGMRTTTVSLTYKGDDHRVLCAYGETRIRIGSMVQVNSDGPTCCCPPAYNRSQRRGSFFCPRDTARTGDLDGGGPFVKRDVTPIDYRRRDKLQHLYPFCHRTQENEDVLMCSREMEHTHHTHDNDNDLDPAIRQMLLGSSDVFYTAPCRAMEPDDGGVYSTDDLNGAYADRCPFGTAFEGCGLADASNGVGCSAGDSIRSFAGEVGRVVRIPDGDGGSSSGRAVYYGVTFNDGRTVYEFQEHHLSLEQPRSNYELWFVQRNRFEKILQKKKGFRVVWPECMFDRTNDRYFPYAQLTVNSHNDE